jgi:hypothetical protein
MNTPISRSCKQRGLGGNAHTNTCVLTQTQTETHTHTKTYKNPRGWAFYKTLLMDISSLLRLLSQNKYSFTLTAHTVETIIGENTGLYCETLLGKHSRQMWLLKAGRNRDWRWYLIFYKGQPDIAVLYETRVLHHCVMALGLQSSLNGECTTIMQ